MKLVTNIRSVFGQDSSKVYTQCKSLNNQLSTLLKSSNPDPKEVTFLRGKLIHKTQQLYELEKDPGRKIKIKQSMQSQLSHYNAFLTKRIQDQKRSTTYSISTELGLKNKRRKIAIKELRYGQSDRLIANLANVIKQSSSTVGTVAKLPIKVVFKTLDYGIKVAFVAGTWPFHIVLGSFSKVINPDKEYQGKTINNVKGTLEGFVLRVVSKVEDAAIRM